MEVHRNDSCIIHSNQPRDHSSLCIITLASFPLSLSSIHRQFSFLLNPAVAPFLFFSLVFVLLTRESAGGSSSLFFFSSSHYYSLSTLDRLHSGHQPVDTKIRFEPEGQFNRNEEVLYVQLMPRFSCFSRATSTETCDSLSRRLKSNVHIAYF